MFEIHSHNMSIVDYIALKQLIQFTTNWLSIISFSFWSVIGYFDKGIV